MTVDRLNAYGVLLLRLALGTMFLAHSIVYMLMTLTLPGTAEFFVSIGLPAWLAYVTFAAEAVGGVLLILGVQTRWVALALSPLLLGATWAHAGNGWMFACENGADGNIRFTRSCSALRRRCSATAPTPSGRRGRRTSPLATL
jgi:putative oxidoreductase